MEDEKDDCSDSAEQEDHSEDDGDGDADAVASGTLRALYSSPMGYDKQMDSLFSGAFCASIDSCFPFSPFFAGFAAAGTFFPAFFWNITSFQRTL